MSDQRKLKRAREMLKIAANVIRDHAEFSEYEYDGIKCDGICIADDCESAADGLEELKI